MKKIIEFHAVTMLSRKKLNVPVRFKKDWDFEILPIGTTYYFNAQKHDVLNDNISGSVSSYSFNEAKNEFTMVVEGGCIDDEGFSKSIKENTSILESFKEKIKNAGWALIE